MAMQEKYENLPGVKVDYEDGNLYSGLNTVTVNTQAVLLIGSAIDGPVGQVVSVNEIGGPKAAENLYGGMFKKELRDAIPTLAEFNAPYNTDMQGTEHVIILSKAASGETPVVPSSVTIKYGTTTLERVDKKENLAQGKFYVDPITAIVFFHEPYFGLKVTYNVMSGQVVKVPHQGNLVRGMYELVNAGCEDIRLLRIAGRKAKTELLATDPAQELTDNIGTAAGSYAFNGSLVLDVGTADGTRLVTSQTNPLAALRFVREKDKETGEVVAEYTGNAMADVVLNIDTTVGAEKVYFKANAFRPNNLVEVGFQFIRRTNTFVGHLDPDGAINKSADPTTPRFYESAHPFWSDDPAKFAQFEIYVQNPNVDGGTPMKVPMTDLAGSTYYWKFGKNPANDPNGGIKPNADGGITFMAEYDTWAASQVPQYPQITDPETKVTASYWYYSESTPIESSNTGSEFVAPGSAQTFELKYTPSADGFKLYYEKGMNQVVIQEKTVDNPEGHYTLDLSGNKPKVVIDAGVAPVGAKFVASYKTFENGSAVNPTLVVEGLYGGTIYGSVTDPYTEELKGVQVEVRVDEEDGTSLELVFYKPEEKRLTAKDLTLVYQLKNLRGIRTLGELANYINNDSANNIVTVSAPGHAANVAIEGLQVTNGPVTLGMALDSSTGLYNLVVDESKDINDPDRFPYTGTDGFFNPADMKSMKDLYEALGGVYKEVDGQGTVLVQQGVYNKIENYATDIIVLLEAYANTPIGREEVNVFTGEQVIVKDDSKSFATQLAQHCAIVTAKTWEVIGVIGTAPVESTDLFAVQDYIDELTVAGTNEHYMYNEATGELILNDDGEVMDIGRYVNVVFGPELGQTNARLGGYVASGVTLYAGLISTLPIENSTTNKEISAQGVRYNLSEAQMNQLSGGRYVCFEQKRDISGTTRIVVKDGVTAALSTSDYNRLSTVRITHGTVQLIRRKADPFIGLPNGMAQRNSLATEIQAGLDALKEAGVLQDFKFSIYTSAKERVLGNAFITLELVPQFELRKIYTSVALRSSL